MGLIWGDPFLWHTPHTKNNGLVAMVIKVGSYAFEDQTQ